MPDLSFPCKISKIKMDQLMNRNEAPSVMTFHRGRVAIFLNV